jgi:glycosyltransferase involved in cell wall biosynthesis
MQNLPKTDIPVILTEHNVEYEVYSKYAAKANLFFKPFLLFDIAKLKSNEKKAWKKADQLIAVSPKEQKIMGSGTELVPNGVDISRFKLKKFDFTKKSKVILFIGNFKWIQNRDSVAFILKNVWPRIIFENKGKFDLKFWVVGKNIPDSIKNLKDETVFFDENAPDDTVKIFQSSDILLTPIRVGGGSNFKILESMAVGTPVVTSLLGNEGLEAKQNEEIFLCTKPEEYAQVLLKIINDNYLYEKVSRNGRKFIEDNFDWIQISNKLDNIYKKVVNR